MSEHMVGTQDTRWGTAEAPRDADLIDTPRYLAGKRLYDVLHFGLRILPASGRALSWYEVSATTREIWVEAAEKLREEA